MPGVASLMKWFERFACIGLIVFLIAVLLFTPFGLGQGSGASGTWPVGSMNAAARPIIAKNTRTTWARA